MNTDGDNSMSIRGETERGIRQGEQHTTVSRAIEVHVVVPEPQAETHPADVGAFYDNTEQARKGIPGQQLFQFFSFPVVFRCRALARVFCDPPVSGGVISFVLSYAMDAQLQRSSSLDTPAYGELE